MKIVAIMPIKLNNERLPGKNTKMLGGKPLLRYALEEMERAEVADKIYVYCSSDEIVRYLPAGIHYLRRSADLDLPTSNFTQIFSSFMNAVDADVYIYTHATAPFVTAESIRICVGKVLGGEYDSAFTATEIRDFLWQDNQPLNFDAANVPRSQDLKPIYRESSGIYVFTKKVFQRLNRRIGEHPYILGINMREAVDINTAEDFKMAELLLNQ